MELSRVQMANYNYLCLSIGEHVDQRKLNLSRCRSTTLKLHSPETDVMHMTYDICTDHTHRRRSTVRLTLRGLTWHDGEYSKVELWSDTNILLPEEHRPKLYYYDYAELWRASLSILRDVNINLKEVAITSCVQMDGTIKNTITQCTATVLPHIRVWGFSGLQLDLTKPATRLNLDLAKSVHLNLKKRAG